MAPAFVPPRPMRLGYTHQLTLLLTGAVLATALGLGGVSAWSLRNGFRDYLRDRDEDALERFAALVEARAATDPQLNWLRHSREAMRELVDTHERQGLGVAAPPPSPPAAAAPQPAPEADTPTPPTAPEPARRSPPPPAASTPVVPVTPWGPPTGPGHARPDEPPALLRPPDRTAPMPSDEGHHWDQPPPRGWRPPRPNGPPPAPGEDRPPPGGRPGRPPPPQHSTADPGRPQPLGTHWASATMAAALPTQATRPLRAEPPPPRPVGSFAGRVEVLDAQRAWVAGRAASPPGSPTMPVIERPLRAAGQTVGYVRLALQADADASESRFLRKQYLRLGGAMLGTLVLSCLLAAWLAQRWSQPVRALQRVTRRIARGDLSVRTEPSGAREIAELMGDVNTMAATLARQEQSRRQWVAQVSHELRTPLSVLLGELEAVQDGARQPTPELVASLREEVLHLGRIVNDLHTLAVADLGELPCVWRAADATEVVEQALQRFERRAQRNGLHLVRQGALGRLPVRWDVGRIAQMLDNLLENSLRYTHAPGEVRLGVEGTSLGVRLVVEDSAPGVTPEQLPLLFEPLYRTDSARQRTGSAGSGLGLSIARAIATAHGGRIQARTSALGGLAIEIDLPREAG